MADDTPERSSVRAALSIVGAVDRLLAPGNEGDLVQPAAVVDAIEAVVRAAKELRPGYVDEVLEYLNLMFVIGPEKDRADRLREIDKRVNEDPTP